MSISLYIYVLFALVSLSLVQERIDTSQFHKHNVHHCLQARKFREAVKYYSEAIEADPNSETAALCLSNRSAAYRQYVIS